jgi:hypothetical protein
VAVDIPVYENLLAPLHEDDAPGGATPLVPVDPPAEGDAPHHPDPAVPALTDPLELYDVDEPFGTIAPEPPPA